MSSSWPSTPLLTGIKVILVSDVRQFHRSRPYLFQKSHDLPMVSPLLMVGSVP